MAKRPPNEWEFQGEVLGWFNREISRPPDQLYIEVRAWFLEIIRTDCPQVLDDRWTEVFLPRRAALSQTAAVEDIEKIGI